MKLFGQKVLIKPCGCKNTPQEQPTKDNSKQDEGIKILGSGCAKCIALEQATQDAVKQLQLDLEIEHITDFAQIASYGVMSTPALVLNGKVLSYGKVLSVKEVKELLSQA